VALLDPLSIAFKAERTDNYRLVLRRSQPFASTKNAVIPEIRVVRAFIAVLASMVNYIQSDLKDDLLSTFSRRIVAKALSENNEGGRIILAGIDQMIRWADRTYEGSPISAAIGFRYKEQDENSPTLTQICKEDFGAVISNGLDTLLEFDFSGRFISHTQLPAIVNGTTYYPYRQSSIAGWTSEDSHGRRVALSLNRRREILVFRDGQLLFVRRSGQWHFLTHEPIILQMGTPQDKTIRRAVYETCLDASFARTGACIGIVSRQYLHKLGQVLKDDDDIRIGDSIRIRTIRKITNGQFFHSLDRRLRQELAGIDGATIISNEGELLTVGAILTIRGGSTSGGRLAAAKAISKCGLGIKVSQDGGILGFRLGQDEPAFQLM